MADADGDAAELAALELEALEATYAGGPLDFGEIGGDGDGEDTDADDAGGAPAPADDADTARPFFRVDRAAYPPIVSVHLTPRGAGRGSTFVEAVLTLSAPPGYPSVGAGPVAVSLSAVRGLGEARAAALQAALAREAGAAVGDAALGTLIEAGLDGLSALNAPEPGALCALCLDPLVADGEPDGGGGAPAGLGPGPGPPKGLLKLACYHCLHLCVFFVECAGGGEGGGGWMGRGERDNPNHRSMLSHAQHSRSKKTRTHDTATAPPGGGRTAGASAPPRQAPPRLRRPPATRAATERLVKEEKPPHLARANSSLPLPPPPRLPLLLQPWPAPSAGRTPARSVPA
jgi:hypothetical protein